LPARMYGDGGDEAVRGIVVQRACEPDHLGSVPPADDRRGALDQAGEPRRITDQSIPADRPKERPEVIRRNQDVAADEEASRGAADVPQDIHRRALRDLLAAWAGGMGLILADLESAVLALPGIDAIGERKKILTRELESPDDRLGLRCRNRAPV